MLKKSEQKLINNFLDEINIKLSPYLYRKLNNTLISIMQEKINQIQNNYKDKSCIFNVIFCLVQSRGSSITLCIGAERYTALGKEVDDYFISLSKATKLLDNL